MIWAIMVFCGHLGKLHYLLSSLVQPIWHFSSDMKLQHHQSQLKQCWSGSIWTEVLSNHPGNFPLVQNIWDFQWRPWLVLGHTSLVHMQIRWWVEVLCQWWYLHQLAKQATLHRNYKPTQEPHKSGWSHIDIDRVRCSVQMVSMEDCSLGSILVPPGSFWIICKRHQWSQEAIKS